MADLAVEQLTKEYATRGEPLRVLREVRLEASAGDSVAIIGPSGSGKSTLLHILGTLERPTSGSVRLHGIDPFALSEPDLAKLRREKLGFVFQEHHLLPQCSVLENVLLPTVAHGRATPAEVAWAGELLDRVGLADRREHRPAELSGGERQRTAIARALIGRPALLLADEPTGNLDRTTAEHVTELLLELQARERLMLIVVTHSMTLAGRLGRRYELDGGQLKSL